MGQAPRRAAHLRLALMPCAREVILSQNYSTTTFGAGLACTTRVLIGTRAVLQRGDVIARPHLTPSAPDPRLVSADGGRTVLSLFQSDYVEPYLMPIMNILKIPGFVRSIARRLPFKHRVAMMLGTTNEKTVRRENHEKMPLDFVQRTLTTSPLRQTARWPRPGSSTASFLKATPR